MISVKRFLSDARHFQITYLTGFLLFGIFQLNWTEYIYSYIVALTVSVASQVVLSKVKLGKISGVKSALITALGLCILLRTNSLWIMAAAAAIAIASKFFIRFKTKHILNPSHIGIIAVLVLTASAWVSPGQWGNETLLMFAIIATGSIVLLKVGRLDITYVFLITLFMLEYSRTILYLGWEMDVLLHKFSSGSLLFFAFFMITDPRTTPDNKKARYLWTMLLAVLTFVLSQWFYLYTATIWAYLVITPVTLLADKYFPAQRFSWKKSDQVIKPISLSKSLPQQFINN